MNACFSSDDFKGVVKTQISQLVIAKHDSIFNGQNNNNNSVVL